jgi:parvulin-like peptidyl-prolyl isomerase
LTAVRWLIGLACSLVCAAPAAAQTDDVVFTVTGTERSFTATEAELAHWVRIARKSHARPGDAFRLLIRNAWLAAEADLRDVTVTDADVQARLDEDVALSFPSRRAYRRFLKRSGQTEADMLLRVRMDMISMRLIEPVVAEAEASVTDAVVDAYLAKHGNLRIPEMREVRMVLTTRRAAAVAAKRELRAGATWDSVAGRYAVEPSLAGRRRVVRGTLERRLNRRVFRARARRIIGPVRTQFGFYVFRVSRIFPERVLSTARSRRLVRPVLVERAQIAAIDRYTTEWSERWRSSTVCAPDYVENSECGNGSGSSRSPMRMLSSRAAGRPSPAIRSTSSSRRSERQQTASRSSDAEIMSAWWSSTSRSPAQ